MTPPTDRGLVRSTYWVALSWACLLVLDLLAEVRGYRPPWSDDLGAWLWIQPVVLFYAVEWIMKHFEPSYRNQP